MNKLGDKEFVRMLLRGRGCVIEQLRMFDARQFRRILFETLRDPIGFDNQIEGYYTPYLNTALTLADPSGVMTRRLLKGLAQSRPSGKERSGLYHRRNHLFQLALLRARLGDRNALRLAESAISKIGVLGNQSLDPTHYIRMRGFPGLMKVLRSTTRDRAKGTELWACQLETWTTAASALSGGIRAVRASLQEVATRNPDIRAVLRTTNGKKSSNRAASLPVRPNFKDSVRPPAIEFVMRWIRKGSGRAPSSEMRVCIRGLDANVSSQFCDLLISSQTEKEICRCLAALRLHPPREATSRLLELMSHRSWIVRTSASDVLCQVKSKNVRNHADQLLSTGSSAVVATSTTGVLLSSFVKGDEDFVLRAAKRVAGDEHVHSVLLDLRKLVEKYPTAAWRDCLIWAYQHAPCAHCRTDFFETLVKRHEATPELLRESLQDCSPETRQIAKRALRARVV